MKAYMVMCLETEFKVADEQKIDLPFELKVGGQDGIIGYVPLFKRMKEAIKYGKGKDKPINIISVEIPDYKGE